MKYTNKALLSLLVLALTMPAISVNAMESNSNLQNQERSENDPEVLNSAGNDGEFSGSQEQPEKNSNDDNESSNKTNRWEKLSNIVAPAWEKAKTLYSEASTARKVGIGIGSLAVGAATVYGIKKLNDSVKEKRFKALENELEQELARSIELHRQLESSIEETPAIKRLMGHYRKEYINLLGRVAKDEAQFEEIDQMLKNTTRVNSRHTVESSLNEFCNNLLTSEQQDIYTDLLTALSRIDRCKKDLEARGEMTVIDDLEEIADLLDRENQ